MKVLIWPFCSQIDKLNKHHLLATCGACKQLSFVADKIAEELRWDVEVALPLSGVGNPFKCPVVRVRSPIDNPAQRVHWDAQMMRAILPDVDILIANHEFLAIPARRMFPDLKIAQMCSVQPDDALFSVAWNSADLVVAQGIHAAMTIQSKTDTLTVPWKLAFDEDAFAKQFEQERDVDVLFVQRCSATNYTHHEEFLRCDLSGLRVAFTDVTGYLRSQRHDLEYTTPATYMDYLYRSKVAVALNDNMYGGLSIREAARAGCTLVCLDRPCYRELRGAWLTDLGSLSATIRIALKAPQVVDVAQESYQAAWPFISNDLRSLARSWYDYRGMQEIAQERP